MLVNFNVLDFGRRRKVFLFFVFVIVSFSDAENCNKLLYDVQGLGQLKNNIVSGVIRNWGFQ